MNALRFRLLAAGLLVGLLSGCGPATAPAPTTAAAAEDDTVIESMFGPAAAPATMAQNDPPPAAPTPAAGPVNPQIIDKIIEDNISMREEIRRLRLERENLIRLLRAMGESYDPVDPDQKKP